MKPDTAATGDLQHDSEKRDGYLARLLDHCERIPDAQEVFELLDVLRDMDALSSDEAAMLMHSYWQGAR